MTAGPHLHVRNLRCVRQQKEIFKDLSLQLSPSQVLLVEGPNGSGKSSLLRLLAGLSTPLDGDIFWCDQHIQDLRTDYSQDLHFVGHTNGIKLGLTVIENLKLAAHLSLSAQADFDEVLSLLRLNAHAHVQAKYLSAGQKRRLGLAKLFLFPKPLWIIDEPLTALDSETQTLFLSWLTHHSQQGGMAIISSHHAIPFNSTVLKTLRLRPC